MTLKRNVVGFGLSRDGSQLRHAVVDPLQALSCGHLPCGRAPVITLLRTYEIGNNELVTAPLQNTTAETKRSRVQRTSSACTANTANNRGTCGHCARRFACRKIMRQYFYCTRATRRNAQPDAGAFAPPATRAAGARLLAPGSGAPTGLWSRVSASFRNRLRDAKVVEKGCWRN